KHTVPQLPGRIPLVKDLETCSGNGFLSHRQRTWVEGMPNDDHTENPVQYKNSAGAKAGAGPSRKGEGVPFLPPRPCRRLGRSDCGSSHSLGMAALLSQEMELSFLEPGKAFLARLSESDRTIECLFQSAERSSSPETHTIQVRQCVTPSLVWSPMINQALLANRRAIARLFINLMEMDMKRNVFHRTTGWWWKSRHSLTSVKEWGALPFPQCFGEFCAIHTRPQATRSCVHFRAVLSLAAFPPQDTHNVQYMMRIRIQYEKVCQECLSKVQEFKQRLLDMKICTEKEAENMVNPNLFQLVGKLQSRFEHEMEKMDKELEQLAKHTEINCRHLCQYFQDALVLLDTHQQGLSHQENDLQNKLNDCRNKHEHLNKVSTSLAGWEGIRKETLGGEEFISAQATVVLLNRYAVFYQDLLSKVTAYPDYILRELISYSTSLSRYFYVKDIYKGIVSCSGQGAAPLMLFPGASSRMLRSYSPVLCICTETTEEAEDITEMEETLQDSPEHVHEEETEHPEEEEEEKVEEENAGESEKLGKTESSAPDSDGLGIPEGRASFFLESDDVEKSEDGSIPMQEGRDIHEACKQAASRFPSLFPNHRIRLQFFEHLENWFAQSLSNASAIVAAKKEELSSELQLRIHLHEPRRERIEKDVYHVRMAELRLHNERLARHCAGLVEALNAEKAAFFKLRHDQNKVSKTFRHKIQDMENMFLVEGRAEKLVTLSNNLHSELINHMEVLQVSLRSYRQYLEEMLGKLREANTDFLKSCKLFANGGNFSPEELDVFLKRLQKESGRIDFVEGLIMIDMEKMESSYLEQATEVINKFENRFRFLAMDRVFMEKIQRFLTNIQVKIKSEVQMERVWMDGWMDRWNILQWKYRISKLLYKFAQFLTEELKKRSKYLNCLLVNLVNSFLGGANIPKLSAYFWLKLFCSCYAGLSGVFSILLLCGCGHSALDFIPSSLSPPPPSPPSIFLKEFYKKDKHQITRPEFLQDTYDQCLDVMGQKLTSYLLQADEYHIACISEFRDQLKIFEEQLPHITQLVIDTHLKDHEQLLRESTDQIRHHLQDQLQKWDINKAKLCPSLGHPHNLPQLEALCQEEVKRQSEQAEGIHLCTKELESCVIECAQGFVSTLADATEKILVGLDNCLTVDDVQQGKIEHPREKVSTLIRRKKAGLSLEAEECKLVAERGSRTWPGLPRTTLLALPSQIICRETASVTTAKTTLGHVAAVEERDVAYVVFWRVPRRNEDRGEAQPTRSQQSKQVQASPCTPLHWRCIGCARL
uniref:Coiled-coil domain containing 180 n=1 Tax=Varanus komodoensis TaxID=61221 RepID=A0A8D2IW98_VARKO